MNDSRPVNLLLIGPLPPPLGGASVSFKVFLDWATSIDSINIARIIDSSPRDLSRSWKRILDNIYRVPRIFFNLLLNIKHVDSVVFFSSNSLLIFMGPIILFIARCFRKSCYLRCFGGSLDRYIEGMGALWKGFILRWLSAVDGLVVQTKLLMDYFQPHLGNRVHMVPGYRIPTMQPAAVDTLERIDTDGLRLVFLSQIMEDKGVFTLLESLRSLSNDGQRVICDFYGPIRKEIESRFLQEVSSIPITTYKGVVDPEHVIDTLSKYDVMVLPSTYPGEGHPGVIVEAMMAGIPVIATRFRSIPEIVQHGCNGLLVEPGSVESLSDAIIELACNETHRLHLSTNSLARASHFYADAVLPRLLRSIGIQAASADISAVNM